MSYKKDISLLNAIDERRPVEVQRLLDSGANPNFVDPGADGNTPLHEAVKAKSPEIVELLLSKGALCDTPNYHGVTPRMLAKEIEGGSEKNEILLKFKKQPAKTKRKVPAKSKDTANDVEIARLPGEGEPSRINQSANEEDEYSRRKGTSAIEGQLYESKMLALVYFRLSQLFSLARIERFQVGTNLDKIGNFDDIVVRMCRANEKPVYIFVQAKHREDPTKKKFSFKTLNIVAKDDFSLHTNFKNYLDLRKEFKPTASNSFFKVDFDRIDVKLILFSPAMFEDIESSEELYFEQKNVDETDLLHTVDTGKALNFKRYTPIIPKLVNQARKQLVEIFDERDDNFFNEIAEDFLSKFSIYAHQAKQDEVGQILQQKIFKVEKKCSDHLLFGEFHACILKHWMDGKDTIKFLNQNVNLFEKTKNFITLCALSQNCSASAEKLELEYKSTAMPQELQHIFENSSKKMVYIHSSVPVLSAVKLFQYLKTKDIKSYCIVDLNSIEKHFDIMSAFSQAEQFDKLIVVADNDDCSGIRKIIAGNVSDKKIIVLSLKALESSSLEDRWNGLEYLTDECQNRIMENSAINYQGRQVSLKNFLDTSNVSLSAIDGKLLLQICNGESIDLAPVTDRRDFDLAKFVNQQFGRRGTVQEKHLEDSFNITRTFGNIRDENKDIVVVHDTRDLYERMCQRYEKRNVHWFIEQRNQLIWKESFNGMEKISLFLDLYKKKFAVKTYNDIQDKFMILAAESGMGKSTVLTGLTKQTEGDGIGWVLRVNLLVYCEYFKNMTGIIDLQAALEFIIQSGFSITKKIKLNMANDLIQSFSYLDGQILEGLDLFIVTVFAKIYNDKTLTVLFDGFDEIAPRYEGPVLKMINALKFSRVAKLIVTTRNTAAQITLEQSLAILAYSLEPFSQEKIREFFLKFWNVRDEKGQVFVNELIKHCLNVIMTDGETFLGIPLHAEMVGTCFKQILEDFCSAGSTKPALEFIEREKYDLVSMYENFIDSKMKIFIQDKSDLNIDHAFFDEQYEYQCFYAKHKRLALMMCFAEEDLHHLLSPEDRAFLTNDLHITCERQGLIYRIVNGIPQFVHLSFAEFFVALVLWEMIKTRPDQEFRSFCGTILMGNLVRNDRRLICQFVQLLAIRDKDNITNFVSKSLIMLEYPNEDMLKKQSCRLLLGAVEHSLTNDESRKKIVDFFKRQDNTRKMQLFTAFCMMGYQNLVRAFKGLLEKSFLQRRSKFNYWHDRPLLEALKNNKVETAAILVREFEYDCYWKQGPKVLMCHILDTVKPDTLKSLVSEGIIDCNTIFNSSRGQHLPLVYLLRKGPDEDVVLHFLNSTNLNVLIQSIQHDPDGMTSQLVRYSDSLTTKFIAEGVPIYAGQFTIPTIISEVRFGYFKFLLQNGVGFDLASLSMYKNNLIANVEFLELIRNFCNSNRVSLEKMILKSLVTFPCPKDIIFDQQTSEAFLYFDQIKDSKIALTLNNRNNFAGQSIDDTEQMIDVLDLRKVPAPTEEIIEFRSAIFKSINFIIFCNVYNQGNVSAKLDELIHWRSLIMCMEQSYDDLIEAVQTSCKDVQQFFQTSNFEYVKTLVNCRKDNSKTPLAIAVQRGDVELTNLLLDKGASLTFELLEEKGMQKDFFNPFHLAAYHGNLEVVKSLYEFDGGLVNAATTGMEHIPLHLAVIGGHVAVVEYLLPKTSNINALNKYSETPLKLAIQYNHKAIEQILRRHNAIE